jgi:hypothetical protein
MKKISFLIVAAALLSFTVRDKTSTSSEEGTKTNEVAFLQKEHTFRGGDNDTISISTDDSTAIKVTKGELKRILKKDPELNSDLPFPPDICWGKSLKNDIEFDCEACRDQYYALYAYFLREKNGEAKYRAQRKTLITLYRDINDVFGMLNGGGTYYGHQYIRILGYAEFSVYAGKDNDYYNRPHNLAGQKSLYIKSLKQYIYDEVNNNTEYSPKEKVEKQKETLKSVKDIDRLITTYFYLNMAQEFQYSHY